MGVFARPSRRTASASPMHSQGLVQGAITGRDVFRHSLTILRLWGPGVYLRCVRAVVSGRACTFLGVVAEHRS
jgi:hypothetical protein